CMVLLPWKNVFSLKNHKVLRGQNVGPSEAAVKVGIERNKPKKAEVREVDIELGFRVTFEEKTTNAMVRIALLIDTFGAASHAQAR
ncbi:hypothetical protein LAN14_24995, partial [Mycobacterium tuberculosis]|nr:hypothetical protein [Mycobacterium tuberculosis]